MSLAKKIYLIRHGQSLWNKQNKFTGWVDVDLSEQGVEEASNAAATLKSNHVFPTMVFTSELLRAQRTAEIINTQLKLSPITHKSWKLNERHYGALQGLNKKETADKYGTEQVHTWRRSYLTKPPQLEPEDANKFNPPCAGESLADTVVRVKDVWQQEILPKLSDNQTILIAAHGNSLRALMKILFSISDDEIVKLEIPTGRPIVCHLDENNQGLKYSYLEQSS